MIWDDKKQNRRHLFIKNRLTGKAVRIYPNLNALDFSDGEEIGPENVEQVARRVLDAVEVFSHVDQDKLTLLRVRQSRSGMWLISFEQIHQGFPVYGAGYGMTIGRQKTVLSIGGDVYDVTMTTDLEVQPTITSCQVAKCLLGDDAEIINNPTLMIYPYVSETEITYILAWVASVDDGGDSRKVVVDAFSGEILVSESLVIVD